MKKSYTIEKVVLKPVQANKLPPILLVHGAWHAAWCWEVFAQALNQKGYEVHYFSLPGHGGTSLNKASLNDYSLNEYVAFLSDRIDEIQPAPIVIGHSMGGALLQIYLQNKKLPGAVLLASIPRYGTLSLIARIGMRYPRTLIKSILMYKSEVIVESAARSRELFYSADNPVDYRRTQKLLGPESMKILLQLMWYGTFKKIKHETPVYVIAGDRDKITSVPEQQQLAQYLNAKLTIIEGQAHCLMLEPKYKELINYVDKWVKNTVI
ncbi:MAG TPA: alpha/beta hydrolase [Gammaproteobacteria bacterium]|nr:alpha/beta hydrolase [Gammaproteobacteria bacterium]